MAMKRPTTSASAGKAEIEQDSPVMINKPEFAVRMYFANVEYEIPGTDTTVIKNILHPNGSFKQEPCDKNPLGNDLLKDFLKAHKSMLNGEERELGVFKDPVSKLEFRFTLVRNWGGKNTSLKRVKR